MRTRVKKASHIYEQYTLTEFMCKKKNLYLLYQPCSCITLLLLILQLKKQTIFQEDVKVVYQPSGRCMVLTAGETISNQLSGVIVLFAATAASNRQYTVMSIYWIMG
jgi:hypothetical protein